MTESERPTATMSEHEWQLWQMLVNGSVAMGLMNEKGFTAADALITAELAYYRTDQVSGQVWLTKGVR